MSLADFRVPVLCECCDLSSVTSSQLARGPRVRHYVMEARKKFVQEHVMSRLKVGWALVRYFQIMPFYGTLTSWRHALSDEQSNGLWRRPYRYSPDIRAIVQGAGDVFHNLRYVLNVSQSSVIGMRSYAFSEVALAGATGGTNNEYVTGVGERVTLTAMLVQSTSKYRLYSGSGCKKTRTIARFLIGRGHAVANLSLQFFQDYQNGLTNPVGDDVLSIGSTTHLVNLVSRQAEELVAVSERLSL